MSVVPSGFAEVAVELEVPGDSGPAYNIFGVDFGTLPNPQAIADAIAVDVANASGYLGALQNAVTVTQVKVRANYGGPDLFLAESTVSQVGTGSGAVCPPNVAILITKRTGLAGRQNRGRMYIPSPAEANVGDDGVVAGAALTGYQNAINTFLSDLSASGADMVILHDNPALTPTPVDSLIVRPKVATQRRRLR